MRRSRRVVASVDIPSLFADGAVGGYWPVALGNLWQDAAKTTPAGLGDPVHVVGKVAGTIASDAVAPSSVARPILTLSASGKYLLEYDGVDDALIISHTWANTPDYIFAGRAFDAQPIGGYTAFVSCLSNNSWADGFVFFRKSGGPHFCAVGGYAEDATTAAGDFSTESAFACVVSGSTLQKNRRNGSQQNTDRTVTQIASSGQIRISGTAHETLGTAYFLDGRFGDLVIIAKSDSATLQVIEQNI